MMIVLKYTLSIYKVINFCTASLISLQEKTLLVTESFSQLQSFSILFKFGLYGGRIQFSLPGTGIGDFSGTAEKLPYHIFLCSSIQICPVS